MKRNDTAGCGAGSKGEGFRVQGSVLRLAAGRTEQEFEESSSSFVLERAESRTRTRRTTNGWGLPKPLTVAALLLALGLPLRAAEPVAEPAAEPVAVPVRFINSVGMELAAMVPGSYLCYGCDIKTEFLFPKPNPGFIVKIEKTFHIGVTEVTREQYAKVMGLRAGWVEKVLDRPVVNVSWNDAVAFCKQLSELPEEKAAGRVYSLPSEREWQYAARAGSEFLFPYGNDDETKIAEVAVCRDIYSGSLPTNVQSVGTKTPNAWGLYDVLGNAWEWVQDAWPARDNIASVTPSASAAAWDKGDNRIVVGGGWDNDFRMCNLAARYSAPPTRRADNIGFRVKGVVAGKAE